MKISEESYEEQKRILEEQQKKLERKFIKKSENIEYSTKIFKNQPQISFHNFEEQKEDGTTEVIGVFILKYEIRNYERRSNYR
jgi:hypothetical protein